MVIHWRYGDTHGLGKAHQAWKQSVALVIDRPILDLYSKIDPETPLDISTDGKQLIVAPAKPSATPEEV